MLKSNKKICKTLYFFCIISLLNICTVKAQQVLTLEQCKELALKNNKKIQNADMSIKIAEQQKKEAFTKYFPSVSATGIGFMATKPLISMEIDVAGMVQPVIDALPPTILWFLQQGWILDIDAFQRAMQPQKIEMLKNGIIGGVMATQPLFAGGQIITGNRLAKAGVEIRKLQKQTTENEVILSTENYFWQLISLKEKLKTIENSDSLLYHILSDVKVAVTAGLTTRNDILRVELEQNRLLSGKLKVKNGITMLKMVLSQQIGLSADSFNIKTPDIEMQLIASLPQMSYDTSLQNRPEYKLLEKSIDIAKMQVYMETAKNLPTIAIGAGYNCMHFDMRKDNGMKNNLGMIFANISIPITDWWSESYAIKRKKLELQQAENTKREASEFLQQQMQNIQNGLNEAYYQILLAQKAISSAEENLKINTDNYSAGVTTISNLLEAQNLLLQTRDQYTEALAAYFVKLAEWKQVSE